jgi:quercetin dioxygenase-like cupin family protein
MRTVKRPFYLISFFLAATLCSAALAKQSMPPKKVLLEKKVELPAKELTAKMVRVTFAEGYKTPWHTHRGPGPRYVVKGTLKIVEEGKSNVYSAGDVFWESGNRMSAENIGEGEAEVVIFELAPAK